MTTSLHPVNTRIELSAQAKAVLRLTRWREHVPFTIPLTVVGAMLATSLNNLTPDWTLLPVTAANILAMSFAFMINDVVDAPDDALNPRKKQRNVISSGILSHREGMVLSLATALLALVLYAVGGVWAFGIGALTLLLCYLYSAHPLRLKARPITDVVSHALMLSGLLVMTGYFTYDYQPGVAWFVILAAILFSAGGQFYNQVDDYEVDKAAGLQNTVVLIGKGATQWLIYTCYAGALVCMGLAIFSGAFPGWLGTILIITVFSSALFLWDTDMRGNPADLGGAIQKPALLVANMVSLLWLAQALGFLS
ncbi:MAG: prenyltransferase [Anaerolineae bacterium]|jgi:4-hydroxybenzoate polyprenyltransferase|nr:prenyltransferase [Anaerolineae bacterium]